MRNHKKYVDAPKVPEDKDSIPFTLTVEGKWFWNKDIAPASFDGPSLAEQLANTSAESFRIAFFNWLSGQINTNNEFYEIKLSKMNVSPEIETVFAFLQDKYNVDKHIAIKKRLEELEAETARLRKIAEPPVRPR